MFSSTASLIAKFVVLRCMFANFKWVFLFLQSFEWGWSYCKSQYNATHPGNLARKNKIENDPKLLKKSERNRDD